MRNPIIRKMTIGGLLAAMVYIMTAFVRIVIGPIYINFGDAIILFAACYLDPLTGALIGAAGASLADITTGFAVFAPFTAVIKFVMGMVAGLFWRFGRKWLKYLGIIIGPLLMVIGYAFTYVILYDSWGAILLYSPFDLIQAAAAIVIAFALIYAARRVKLMRPDEPY